MSGMMGVAASGGIGASVAAGAGMGAGSAAGGDMFAQMAGQPGGGTQAASGKGGQPAEGSADAGIASLKTTAEKDIASQNPVALQRYFVDTKKGDGNAAAEELAKIANSNPSLHQDVSVLASTVGGDAIPGGGAKLSKKAQHDLKEALPGIQIDTGKTGLEQFGDKLKDEGKKLLNKIGL